MKLKKPIIIFLIFISNLITYQNKYDSLIKDFKNNAISKEAILNRHIDLISGYADIISIFGNGIYQSTESGNSGFLNFIKFNSKENYFHADAIGGTKMEKTEGNLTGAGKIPIDKSVRDELNLAVHFNKVFNKLYHKLPDIKWMSYISENNFINRYPFIYSRDFRYTEDLKKQIFYTKAAPKENDSQKSVWTPVYLNRDKTELIVTYSIPIYYRKQFMGVVTIDFSNFRFKEMIDSKFESCLIDENGFVIASGHKKELGKEMISMEKFMDISDFTANTMKHMEVNKVKRINDYYVYSIRLANAPWKLFIRVPAWTILLESVLTTLPIMLICLFLLLTMNEAEKRKKTARLLRESIVELKSYQKLLESAAKMDFLTTTYNRRGYEEKLIEYMNEAEENKSPISVLIADIDFFKQYNDTYGHTAGDKLLINAADIMKRNVTKKDIVCRWGGEEFLILLFNKTYEEALRIAENIRKDIETSVTKLENFQTITFTITIGVAEYEKANNFDQCISSADKALYEGKEQGRNKVVGSRDIVTVP
ncbi:sensor domain-containing diguanylate cyclase [Anaerocolumna sp. MB42-C2]|uniref:sensor domain-containing diguanylate cyclase n=1 Tax=Anaerocolumna sp. MB42-C2 TaxID=3070997 RepID=UPI0027DEE567|nr:sensor domain-containing diguanylate cyclase [Anaerocolumna sp. MB42-C2]WMJ89668.1 diguanylate cyclase [Anaerocolumna sp. MB42-C2]